MRVLEEMSASITVNNESQNYSFNVMKQHLGKFFLWCWKKSGDNV